MRMIIVEHLKYARSTFIWVFDIISANILNEDNDTQICHVNKHTCKSPLSHEYHTLY